jgi:hypothetical protein
MLTFSQYESYFEDLATRFIPIGHTEEARRFAIMDIDEIISLTKSGMDMDNPCLILENPEGQMKYKHEKILDENLGAFIILKRVSRGDALKKREVMDLTKEIGAKLVAKMQLDKIARFKGKNSIPRMILYFDLSQVGYNKIGPIFSDCYGWRFTFELGQEDKLPYDADDWLHIEEEDD